MRILVSGATGVIGRRLVPLLLAHGHTVTALVRSPAGRAPLESAGAACTAADLFDVSALRKAAAGHDAIVNLATHMPSSALKMMFRRSWRLNDRIRTEGATNIAAAARDCGIATLIQESFALTYPDRGARWTDESTPIAPAAYNRTVVDAERAVAQFSALGRTGIALRFAAFYGPDAMQVRSYIDTLRKGWAALPGSPDAFIPSISHDDAAAAVAAALTAPAGVYNVADDEPLTHRDYIGSLAKALGLPAPRFLPRWATPLLGSVGQAMARSIRLSNGKLKTATGWWPQFPSAREGWPATLRQMGDV